MPIGDDAAAAGYPLVPDTGEAGRVRWGAQEINRTRDFVALVPRGEIGYDEIVANTSNFIVANNATYDIPGLSVTVDLVQNRKYEVKLKIGLDTNSSGSNRIAPIISDGSNNALFLNGYVYIDHAGYSRPGFVIGRYIAAVTGSFTFKGRVFRSTAIGQQKVTAAATSPSFISVNDIGMV